LIVWIRHTYLLLIVMQFKTILKYLMRTALFVTARTMLCESWDVRVLRQLESTACLSLRVPLIPPGSRDKLNTCTPQNPTPWPLATARFSSERKLRYGNQCSSSKVGSTLRWLSSFGAQIAMASARALSHASKLFACDSEEAGTWHPLRNAGLSPRWL
jgi:hypothetical protein